MSVPIVPAVWLPHPPNMCLVMNGTVGHYLPAPRVTLGVWLRHEQPPSITQRWWMCQPLRIKRPVPLQNPFRKAHGNGGVMPVHIVENMSISFLMTSNSTLIPSVAAEKRIMWSHPSPGAARRAAAFPQKKKCGSNRQNGSRRIRMPTNEGTVPSG